MPWLKPRNKFLREQFDGLSKERSVSQRLLHLGKKFEKFGNVIPAEYLPGVPEKFRTVPGPRRLREIVATSDADATP